MEETTQIYNIELIVKDYIRTLKLPKKKSKNPVLVLLIGIPASGKSYLVKNLVTTLPLVMLSENDIQSFLVPKISFLERGQDLLTQFVKELIKNLVKAGFSCILDANLRSAKVRQEFEEMTAKLKGDTVVIYLNCPKRAAYNRIRKRNLEIVRGETEGFILDWDYFQYEINTTQPPRKAENALTFDSSKSDHQLERIISYLKSRLV